MVNSVFFFLENQQRVEGIVELNTTEKILMFFIVVCKKCICCGRACGHLPGENP